MKKLVSMLLALAMVLALAGGAIGRPHIARVLVQHGVVPDVRTAFREYIGLGARAYAERRKMTSEAVIRNIRAAGGVPVLAHGGLLKLSETELERWIHAMCGAGLMGLECYHNAHTPATEAFLRRMAATVPFETGATGLYAPTTRTMALSLAIGSDKAPDRIFLPATRETRSGEPLTSLPEVRLIGAEETDEVSVHCRTQCSALLTATCNGIPTQRTYGVAAEGVALFRLAAAEFPDAEAFDLHLTADGVESHFRYEVAETPAGSRRLAWLNEAGGIDRYTFPLTEERRYEIERRRLLLEESGYTQTEAVGEERLRIGSAYEPAAVLDALARLAAAPAVWAVWAVTEAGWTEVDVVSDSLRIERPGTLQRLSLEIRPRQRGGRL